MPDDARDPAVRPAEVRPPAGEEDRPYREVARIVSEKQGLELDSFRDKCVRRRILLRQRVRRAATLEDYVRLLRSEPEEVDRLVSAVTIDTSGFLRNPPLYDLLRERILPELFAGKSAGPLLFWSAGCACGEEPYSIALVAERCLAGRRAPGTRPAPDFRVLATDVDETSLEAAQAGLYTEDRVRDLDPESRGAYFEPGPAGLVRAGPVLRRRVVFRRANLEDPPPVRSADLVLCRNVLIYFLPEVQERVLENLRQAVRPGGYLALGRVERLLGRAREAFVPADPRERIWRRV